MRRVCISGAKIEKVVLDEGGPLRCECVFHACAKNPTCPRAARVDSRYAREGIIPAAHDVKRNCGRQRMLAVLPGPATLGVDQHSIECGAGTIGDRPKARNLIIAPKADARGTHCAGIKAASAAVDIRPMSIGLDS